MNKRIIVTGGAGFIGSHVCDLLVEKGYSVFVFDNLSTGRLEYVNKKAIFEKIDITKYKNVIGVVSKIKPDCIFHLAAWPRIMRSVDDPVGTNKVNVDGTLVMLEAARMSRVRKFIYSSSSSVYGDQEDYRMKESFTPHPKSLYALQKLVSESYCTFYAELYGIETVSLRYFSVYGDRQPDSGLYALVIGKFLKQIRIGRKLTVYGDGNQIRDFTHVSDVARANLLSLTTKLPKGKNTVLNIGSGRGTSINQIAKYLNGISEHILPNPRGQYEERKKVADIRLAKKILGWEPNTSLKNGLVEFLIH